MLENLQLLHLYCFLAFFVLFGILELFFPLREKISSTKTRWGYNIGFSIINILVARFLLLITPLSVALYLEVHNSILNSFSFLRERGYKLIIEFIYFPEKI